MTFSRRSLFGMALAALGWRLWRPAPMATPIIVPQVTIRALSPSCIEEAKVLQGIYNRLMSAQLDHVVVLNDELEEDLRFVLGDRWPKEIRDRRG